MSPLYEKELVPNSIYRNGDQSFFTLFIPDRHTLLTASAH
ncbi:hypothetical protein SAMD00020551_4944 [Mesobacillus selenatarsenatis SF-1]|uniref:Uncharacterized protein n=1 Tax=Mesobacillus selenatarsenatis (strain DSM 18680 / JCM 14380 / FERM P-15431 / SF-1) TaxID=1321606 RepID=A0A0A8XBQ7_MESS1|nr:hypothetical protein SAMD00020551_4944 [Mesobacillus selenatarsenatis SF-1]